MTAAGRPFRPSDWAERLCGVMSCYRPGRVVAGKDAWIGYSPYVRPMLIGSVKCVVVDERLKDIEPRAFSFVLGVARDNELPVDEGCTVPEARPDENDKGANRGRGFAPGWHFLPCDAPKGAAEAGSGHRLDRGRQAALVARGVVLVDGSLVRQGIDHLRGGAEDRRCGLCVAGGDRLADRLDRRSDAGPLRRFERIALAGLTGPFAGLLAICHRLTCCRIGCWCRLPRPTLARPRPRMTACRHAKP
jgi:Protein of unknown function (DUF3579)